MENTAKIIILILFISQISCKNTNKIDTIDEFKLVKYNLYTNKKDQLFLKLSNKSILHPHILEHFKDTIYVNEFYYNYDSIIRLEDVLNIEKYKIIIPNAKFSDGKYYYENHFERPGVQMHQIKPIK